MAKSDAITALDLNENLNQFDFIRGKYGIFRSCRRQSRRPFIIDIGTTSIYSTEFLTGVLPRLHGKELYMAALDLVKSTVLSFPAWPGQC